MSQMNFKWDKSWAIILALFFFMLPLGIIALTVKIIYIVYKGQNQENSASVASSYDRHPVYKDIKTYETNRDAMGLSGVEEGQKDASSEWKENRDTRVTFEASDSNEDTFSRESDEGPEDHDHEGAIPLKVSTCSMCGTENRIYKIDIYETPTCEKCGMLLLDRN